jgi:hypothetical protein
MNDLRGRLGQPNGSEYGSPDPRVHAGRRQTLETLIPNDNISSRLPDCRVWLAPIAGMWSPLLVCLLYDTRLGPDHKRNRHGILHTSSSTSSIWHRSRVGHTYTCLSYVPPHFYFHPKGETLGQTVVAVVHILSLSSPATIYISCAMPLQMHATFPSASLKRDICPRLLCLARLN